MKLETAIFRRLWQWRHVAWHVLEQRKSLLLLCVLMSLALTALELLRPQPIRFLFDSLLLPHAGSLPRFIQDWNVPAWPPSRIVLVVVASTALISLGIALTSYWLEVRMAYLGNKVVTRLRKLVFRHLLSLPNLFHDSQKTGDLVLRLTGDIQMIREMFIGFMVSFVSRTTMILGLFAMMLWMSPLLTLVALALMPALVRLAARTTARVGELTRRQRQRESDVAQSVHEIIGEMRVFAAYGRKDIEDKKFDAQNRSSARNDLKSRRARARLGSLTELTLAAGACSVIGLGTYEILRGNMSAGELLAFLSYLRTLFKPIRSLADLMGRTGKTVACAERVLDLLATPVQLEDAPDALPAPRFRGDIALRGVTLTYGEKRRALDDLDLSVHAGEVVAIVGPSGSGKSSLCMLIPRIYDPEAGSVQIDGTDIRRFTLESLRGQISLTLQDPGIFDLSIADNVAFGQMDWSLEQVVAACKAAEIHDQILAMPAGYETLVGERGTQLSGGQRRRLALARALLRDPRILILDEPFEGLDAPTAEAVRSTILRIAQGRTTLIVSHHPAHLEGCSRIVRLQEGRVVSDQPALPRLLRPAEARAGT